MGLEYADWLARLDQQRLVVVEGAQGRENLVEAGPVARGAADAAVDHQASRIFRDFGVEIILQHAVSGFGQPAFAVQRGATRGANGAGGIETWISSHDISSKGGKTHPRGWKSRLSIQASQLLNWDVADPHFW